MRTETRIIKVFCDECGVDMTKENNAPVTKTVTVNEKDYVVTHSRTITPVARASPNYDICKACRSVIIAAFNAME